MANKIDRELLLQNMLDAPEEQQPSISENLRYLMDAIVIPLLNDETIPLSSLDYDRFEEDDLDFLVQYMEEIEKKNRYLRQLKSEIDCLSPLCVHQPVFC